MVIFLIICIFILVISYLISTTIKSRNYPPGPKRLPIVGNSLLVKKLSQKLGGQHLTFLKLAKDYNTSVLGLKLGNKECAIVFGRKLVQQIFTNEVFQARPDDFFTRLRTMGRREGITMTDGPLWHEQRNFVEKQLRQLGFGKMVMENLITDELEKFFVQLGDECEEVSLTNKFTTANLNVLWTITAGKRISDEEKSDDLLSLIRQRNRAFDIAGGLLNQLPWMRFICPEYCGYSLIQTFNTKLFNFFQAYKYHCQSPSECFTEAYQYVGTSSKKIITEHKHSLTSENRDFIDTYLHEKEKSNSKYFTDNQLMATCIDLFIAGSSTTGSALDFAIIATVSNPRVQNKLYQELDKVLRPQEMPTMAHKAKLPYVEAILQETLRFEHIIPTAGPRRVLRNTVLGGYSIPKNSIVFMSLRSIHHDDEKWSDPEIFRPERFLNDQGEFVPHEGLCTFGLGKRRCPGEVLAKSFLFLWFTALFHRYNIAFSGDEISMKPEGGIFLKPPPYKVSLKIRQ